MLIYHRVIWNYRIQLMSIFFCFQLVSAAGQNPVAPTIFDSLFNMEVEKVEIYLNIDTLLFNKLTDKEQTGQVKIMAKTGEIILPANISVRSKSRRRHCDFPPIKLDFVKSDLEALGLDNEDDYKVVTHCLDIEAGEEYLLKEYLIYELYRIITPYSLRAKLVDMEYIDLAGTRRLKKKALILESENEFAKKHQGKLCDCMGTPLENVDALQMEIVAMFQYMVGNTDMDHLVERNVKLVIPEGQEKAMMPVAYDFDFSALVNAPYVHKKVEDNRKIQRVYLGFQENAAQIPEVIDLFISKEEEILDYVKKFELISSRERRKCLDYIREFYDEINGDELLLPYKQR